jgi:hypothetical protein
LVLERNEEMRLKFLGSAPILDPALTYLIQFYWTLRRGTPGDQPLRLGWQDYEERDPIMLYYLQAADSAYMNAQAEAQEQRMNEAKSKGPKRSRMH